MPNAILAVDCGTTGLKATLVSRDGRTLATSVSDYRNATASAPGGIVEQLPADWWHAMQQAVAELLLRAEGDSIAAISLSGQMQDLIFVRNDGTVLGPAILYSDSRATEEAAAIEAKIGKDRLCIETGNWKGPLSLLPKLLWCQKHRPEDLASSDAILLGSHSFLALMLCGRAVGDRVTASTTGLLRADGTNYCNDIINEVLPPGVSAKLPPLESGTTVVGLLSSSAAAALGLETSSSTTGIPVFHGCGDAGATTLGVGAGIIGQPYLYCGTSGWVAATVPLAASGAKEGVFVLHHPTDQDVVIEAASCMQAGEAIEWLRKVYHSEVPAAEAYARIDALASASCAGAHGVLFVPWLNGERAPFRDADARACYLGLSSSTSLADLHRAVLEGVCFSFRSLRDTVLPPAKRQDEDGAGMSPLRAVGGGSKSAVWMQILADVLGQDILVMLDGQNAGARGAAVLAGRGLGWYQSLNPPDFYPTGTTFFSRRDGARSKDYGVYDKMYEIYKDLHVRLRRTFAELALVSRD